jgi:hypothetical protein
VDNAVWISLFLVLTISINMFPVKVCIPACLNDDNKFDFALTDKSSRFSENLSTSSGVSS